MDLSEYVFEALRKDEEFILYRGQSKGVASQVLCFRPFAEYRNADRLKRLENEYLFKKEELDPSWATRPICIATLLALDGSGVAGSRRLLPSLNVCSNLRPAPPPNQMPAGSHWR